MVLLPPSSHSRGTMPSTPAGEGTGAGQEHPRPGTHEGHPALQCKPRGVGLSALWGISGKPSSTHPGAPEVRGTDPPPSPTGTPGTNPSHSPSSAGDPCASPAASALKAIQRQLDFTWLPQEGTEPARTPLIHAWAHREKPYQGCLVMAGPGAQLQDHWHSMARDPQPQRSCRANGEPETGDANGIIPSSGVSQANVAAPAPVTKHSPSLGLKGGTRQHPSSQTVPPLGCPTVGSAQRSLQ